MTILSPHDLRRILRHLMHAARRQQATWIHVTHNKPGYKPQSGLFQDPSVPVCPFPNLSVANNGVGIPTPQQLQTPQAASWTDGARHAAAEAPCPLPPGLAATVFNRTANGATWIFQQRPHEPPLILPGAPDPPAPGTDVVFACNLPHRQVLDALQAESRYFPLSVTYESGASGGFMPPLIERQNFLADARYQVHTNALNIGFFIPPAAPRPHVNVYGIPYHALLPRMNRPPYPDTDVRLDLLNAPDIELDPKRGIVLDNPFLKNLKRCLPEFFDTAIEVAFTDDHPTPTQIT